MKSEPITSEMFCVLTDRSSMLTTALGSPSTSSASSAGNANDRVAGSASPASASFRSCRDYEAPSCACPSRRHHQKSPSPSSPSSSSTSSPSPSQIPSATYVYPKLQLVQIDDAWYALNQTCLQIYQQLQMCGTAQLMPVDVVPLNKVGSCCVMLESPLVTSPSSFLTFRDSSRSGDCV